MEFGINIDLSKTCFIRDSDFLKTLNCEGKGFDEITQLSEGKRIKNNFFSNEKSIIKHGEQTHRDYKGSDDCKIFNQIISIIHVCDRAMVHLIR